jgi:3-oxoadipate enol-lactonase
VQFETAPVPEIVLLVLPSSDRYTFGVMPTQIIDGVQFNYQDRGTGLPLVLVHGFPLDGRIWESQLEALSSSCRVIAPDLRGFGKSGPTGPFTLETVADDLHQLLAKLDALPCVLGGLSMGGYIALAFAHKYPQALKGLILIDTKSDADSPEQKDGRMKMAELARSKGPAAVADQMMPKLLAATVSADGPAGAGGRPELIKRVRQIMESCPSETIAIAALAMKDRADHRALLAKLNMPVLVIVGDQDILTPPSIAQSMVHSLPQGAMSLIHGAGHLTSMEQPEQVNRAIREWLARVP